MGAFQLKNQRPVNFTLGHMFSGVLHAAFAPARQLGGREGEAVG